VNYKVAHLAVTVNVATFELNDLYLDQLDVVLEPLHWVPVDVAANVHLVHGGNLRSDNCKTNKHACHTNVSGSRYRVAVLCVCVCVCETGIKKLSLQLPD